MDGILVLLVVLGAPILHAPVLRFDLLTALKAPLDGGATWRGRRLFGANKTWRGALCMLLGCLGATLLLEAVWPAWWDALPDDLQDAGPALVGTLVGLGVVVGELPNSFAKRQLDIAPGTQQRSARGLFFTVLDQGDLVLGIWVALLPVYVMPLWVLAVAFAVVSGVHLLINVIGYAIGARTAPI
ncbi:CDP-archaeol synthase [Conexibacter sp. SYSU D00693]|uniref:CDP-archaeol synthase n=1 Tax=Conexibacter sp. SYSU D00693 TaxID=2812560 RepID=UPI00196A203C|nr:CDP-archaeol synthase [Conexibacter sp. SYSU D00693]